jgi:hypothetical protein
MKRIHFFKTGTHTSMGGAELSFSETDLEAVATSYDPNLHEAPIVVGHPKSDGPAYGWVKDVAFEDDELYATPDQVDPAFAEMVEAGKFKKVSAAFYSPGAANNPTPGSYYLRHIGFLGAQPPAVKGLKPIEFAEDDDLVTFEFGEVDGWTLAWAFESIGKLFDSLRERMIESDGVDKAEEALPKWQIDEIASASGEARAAAREEDSNAFADSGAAPGDDPEPQPQTTEEESTAMSVKDKTVDGDKLKADQDKLAADREQFEQDRAAFAEQQRRTEAAGFVDNLVADGKMPPVHRDGLVAFMASLDGEDAIEFGEGDDAKSETPVQFLKTFLEGLGKTIEISVSHAVRHITGEKE